MIKKSKEMCYARRIEKTVNKGKEVWKIIKEAEDTNSEKKDALSKLDLEDRGIIYDKETIANEINDFFAKIGEQKIGSVEEAMHYYFGENSVNSYYSHEVTKGRL